MAPDAQLCTKTARLGRLVQYLCCHDPVRCLCSDRLEPGCLRILQRLMLKPHVVRGSLNDRQIGARRYGHVNAAVGPFLEDTGFDSLLQSETTTFGVAGAWVGCRRERREGPGNPEQNWRMATPKTLGKAHQAKIAKYRVGEARYPTLELLWLLVCPPGPSVRDMPSDARANHSAQHGVWDTWSREKYGSTTSARR